MQSDVISCRPARAAVGTSDNSRRADVEVVEALTPDMPAARALSQIVTMCRHDLAHRRAAAMASDDPSGIHDVRVALRRLRAALGLFRDVAGGREARAIDAEARDLADAFSPARDLQVLLFETAPDAPEDVARVGAQLVDHRLADARAVLDSRRFVVFERNLAAFAARHAGAEGESLVEFARRALQRCEKRVRRRGRNLSGLGTGELHRLRLAAKRLRYAIDFLAPLFVSAASRDYAEAAAALQDVLGRMNDRRMSHAVLRDIARAGRRARGVRRSCKRLARRVGRPSRKQRAQLRCAWKALKRAEPFWHGSPMLNQGSASTSAAETA